MRYVKNIRRVTSSFTSENTNLTALCRHSKNENNEIDWDNSKILDFESHYYKRRFCESYFIANKNNVMNDKKTVSISVAFSSQLR